MCFVVTLETTCFAGDLVTTEVMAVGVQTDAVALSTLIPVAKNYPLLRILGLASIVLLCLSSCVRASAVPPIEDVDEIAFIGYPGSEVGVRHESLQETRPRDGKSLCLKTAVNTTYVLAEETWFGEVLDWYEENAVAEGWSMAKGFSETLVPATKRGGEYRFTKTIGERVHKFVLWPVDRVTGSIPSGDFLDEFALEYAISYTIGFGDHSYCP